MKYNLIEWFTEMRYFKNYDDAWSYLQRGRDIEKGRPLGAHTRIYKRRDGTIAIRYHSTDIVRYYKHKNGKQWMSFDNEGWTSPTTLHRLCDVMPPGINVDTSLNRFIGQWFTRCDGELYNLNHHVKFDENLNVKNKKQMSLKTTDNISARGTRMRKMLASSLKAIERDESRKRRQNAELSYEIIQLKKEVKAFEEMRERLRGEVGYLLKLKKGDTDEGAKDVLNRV